MDAILTTETNRPAGMTQPAYALQPVSVCRPAHAAHHLVDSTGMVAAAWREQNKVCGGGSVVMITGIGRTDANRTKFSIRVGPASCSPPV